MKFLYVVVLSLLIEPFVISLAKADSVTISTDLIEYEGHKLNGQSLSFNNDMGEYGYELSMQRFNSYSLNEQQDHLNINNEIDLTNISLGLYCEIKFNKFYIRPIVGVVHATVNIHTVLRYQDNFKLLNTNQLINLKYEQYSSKTALLLMYGGRAGYDFNKYFSVFGGIREQVYTSKFIGFKINF